MLNNIYCVPDDKNSQKYVLLFIFHVSLREKKMFTANVALRNQSILHSGMSRKWERDGVGN